MLWKFLRILKEQYIVLTKKKVIDHFGPSGICPLGSIDFAFDFYLF